jgi:hypothetical protein
VRSRAPVGKKPTKIRNENAHTTTRNKKANLFYVAELLGVLLLLKGWVAKPCEIKKREEEVIDTKNPRAPCVAARAYRRA